MIVVRVELWSAVNGSRTELARMHIANDGEATQTNHRIGDYVGEALRGRDTEALNRGVVQKRGSVRGWRRLDFHVWNLVAAMLDDMGYTQGRRPK